MLAYRRQTHSIMDINLNNITEYTKEDMMNPEFVESLYMDCGRYIHITNSGWEFLISHYGYEGLYEIDQKSSMGFYHWKSKECKDNSLAAFIRWIQEERERYPDVPDSVYKSDRPEDIARSALTVGKTVEEAVELFELPPAYVQQLYQEVQEKIEREEYKRRSIAAWRDLCSGKAVEEVAEAWNLPLQYVQKQDNIRKKRELEAKKRDVMLHGFRDGKTVEEIAKETDLPLEYVQDVYQKVMKAWRKSK